MRCAAFLDPGAALLDPPAAFAMRLLASLIRLDVSRCHRPALALRPGDIKSVGAASPKGESPRINQPIRVRGRRLAVRHGQSDRVMAHQAAAQSLPSTLEYLDERHSKRTHRIILMGEYIPHPNDILPRNREVLRSKLIR